MKSSTFLFWKFKHALNKSIDVAKIQNQFEDRLSQLQIELEIGQQRQLSIGR